MRATLVSGLAFVALVAMGPHFKLSADEQGPYQQSEGTSQQEPAVDKVAALGLAKSISRTASLAEEQLDKLISELDAAESRQKILIGRHRGVTQYGNYHHPELRRLDQPLLRGQERVRALRTRTSQARTLVRTLTTLDASFSAVSATELAVEGVQFLQAAGRLSDLGGATREQASAYQQTVDQILAKNETYSYANFLLRLRNNCSPGAAATASCAGLAFNNFARLIANFAVQEAAIRQMLDSSSEIIASRIRSYAEMGARHAREGRAFDFDNLDRPAIFDIEVLARSTDSVISLLDNRSFWARWFRSGEQSALREGAEELKRDLASGAQSRVMRQFRAAYQAAHESAGIEMEIKQIDKQVDQLLSEIEALTKLMDRMAEDLRELMTVLEEAEEGNQAEEAEPEESDEGTCKDELAQKYAPYAQEVEECDFSDREDEAQEDLSETDEIGNQDGDPNYCRALDRPLPAGIASTEYCGILAPQPGIQQFQAACEGPGKLETHTCTVVYCNHVFYRWGAEDIVDCVDKIAAQKDRQAR
ncbi:MAG: hypothetical protein LC637_01585 [Xanthomonadaceae bacterium]|nr:hypothetical protein [Xanthomonadaceae bacterium]